MVGSKKIKNPLTMAPACRMCGITVEITVDRADYDRWQGGEPIQCAFSYLTPGEREILISQTCDECFDSLFS